MSKKIIIIFLFLFFLHAQTSDASEASKMLIGVGVVVGAPEVTLKEGEYVGKQNIEIIRNGAQSYRYTLDASSTLSCIEGTLYSGMIEINESTTLKIISCYDNNISSEVSIYRYKIKNETIVQDLPKRSGGYSSIGKLKSSRIKGEVLGESTSTCSNLINSNIVFGFKNNSDDVIRIQKFLNKEFSIHIPLTGYYGVITRGAVIKLQEKHIVEIYGKEWKQKATGDIYDMTRILINKLECNNKI